MKIVVGEGSCGIAAGAEKVRQALLKEDLNGAMLTIAGCIGMCYLEPIVDIYEDGKEVKRLVRVTENDAKKIAEYAKTGDKNAIAPLLVSDEDKEFLNKQTRIALRRCGIINPDEIEDFIQADGYTAIKKVLNEMTPEDVIEVIKTSGLAGRGGAGFPTWFKWNAARQSDGEEKYLICNADEGDPGAFMDRAVIESDPHTLIEGMLIGAYAIGAKNAVVYVRAEYPLAIKRLERAIEQATEAGYLGDNILGTDFSCKMTIKAGAGAFVCGEETALIESLEGHRGMPRLKPPFPAQSGYWRKPSNINNVETFANVSWIINNGGEAFASMAIPSIALLFPEEFVPIKVVNASRFSSAFSKLLKFSKVKHFIIIKSSLNSVLLSYHLPILPSALLSFLQGTGQYLVHSPKNRFSLLPHC